MQLLLLLLLAGVCCGLQYPLQYHYHYRARVTAGIPDINRKHTGAADVRADLKVYVTSPSTVIFKLEQVEFGEYNGATECDSDPDQPLPVEYHTAWEPPASLLGQSVFGLEDGVVIVNEADDQWVVNFYKSIISLFSVAPLRNTFLALEPSYTHNGAYSVLEGSTMGLCNSTYTQHQLSGVAAVQHQLFIDDHVTEDVQTGVAGDLTAPAKGRKTTGRGYGRGRKTRSTFRKTRSLGRKTGRKGTKAPPSPIVRGPGAAISSTVWQVVRSVSLEDCVERVEHQHSLGGVYCELAGDQCDNLFSRNSQGVYWLRGDQQGMRLEKAEVQGAIVISPYGYETEHLQTLTKQKLALVSVSSLDGSAPDLSSFVRKSYSSVLYEMTLPYQQLPAVGGITSWAKMGTVKETMRDFLGIEVTDEMQRSNEQRVVDMISWAGAQLEAGSVAQVPVSLNYATVLLYEFNDEELARVEAAVPPRYKDLLWGVLTEVGYPPAVRALVAAITRGEVTPLRQALMFGLLNNNLKSAEGLQPLLEFVLSQDLDGSPFRSSQSLVNLASLVQRMCGGGRGREDSFSVIARQQCQQDRVQQRLTEYIDTQLQSTDKFWKQMVLVQALLNLKTAEAYNLLLPYVLGARQCDPVLRAVAMESLALWKAMGVIPQSQATLILLDILENPREGRLLRARALGYLASWPLSSSAWARLALTTRRQGLRDLAAFTYSIIRATADYQHPDSIQQRQFAQHALQLAKPSSAFDRYSSYNTWYKYSFADQFGSINHINLIRDPTSPLPAEVSLYLQRTLGGLVVYKKAELLLAHDTGDVMQIAEQLLRWGWSDDSQAEPSARGQWTNFIRSLGTDLNIEERVRQLVTGLLSTELLVGMQLFVPFEHEMIIDTLLSLSSEGLSPRLDGPKAMYLNPADLTFCTVNDMGLPVLTNVARPTVLYLAGSVVGRADTPTTFSLNVENDKPAHLYSSAQRSHLETIVPWSRSKVSTGASKVDAVSLPFEFRATLELPSASSLRHSLTLRANPTVFDKVPIVSRLSKPYILIRDTVPGNQQAVLEHIKTVYESDTSLPIHRKDSTSVPFTALQYCYEGDREPPSLSKMYYALYYGKEDFVKLMLSPTVKYYQQELTMDLIGSESSFVSLNVTAVTSGFNANEGSKYSIYGKDHFEEYELCGQKAEDIITQQTGQQSTDDDYWDQQSVQTYQSADSEFSDFGSFGQQQQQQSERLYQAETEAETTRPSQGVGDGSTPQLASLLGYLERQAGWNSRIDSISVLLELHDSAGRQDLYEAVGASTVCYNLKDQMETKRVFALVHKLDPCFTTCMESVEVQPKLNDLDTLELIFAKNLSRSTQANFYSGASCGEGPFASVTDKRELTDAGAALLLTELQQLQSCSDDPVDPVAEFHNLAQYDSVTVDASYQEAEHQQCALAPIFAGSLIRMWNKLIKIPSPDKCEKGTPYHGTAERLADKRWKVEQQYGSTAAPTVSRRYPYWIEYVNYLTRNSEYQRRDYCVIEEQSVSTFDGLRVNTSVAECPVLVASSCEAGQRDQFAVAVNRKRTGGLVVNIAAEYKQQVINLEEDGVTINRERMGDHLAVQPLYSVTDEGRQRLEGHVYRRNGFYKVQLDNTLSVMLKEGRVYIEVADRYRGYTCGLCGNLDQNPSNDLVAPSGCLLTQPATFATSWTPSTGFSCFAERQSNSDSCFKEEPLPADYYQQYQY